MGISRTARIYILLVLDLIFFFLEIVIGSLCFIISSFTLLIRSLGYAVGSLALVADSFHMLKYAPSFLFSSRHSLDSFFSAM